MFQLTNLIVGQVPVEETAFVFSSPQFLISLLAGVMMAFAFQFLLTNLSVAIVATPGTLPDSDDDDSDSLGASIRKTESKVGMWALLTVTIALFAASFLAVKLSLVGSSVLGAIIGVVIWSTLIRKLMRVRFVENWKASIATRLLKSSHVEKGLHPIAFKTLRIS
ncbi:hypothetical protein ACKFKG_25770 [Phormidesmis sp. 146-35]